MPPRKERVVVVFDTNVVVGFYLSSSQGSPNARVFRLWRDHRKLQLILSPELTEEYLEVLSRLGVASTKIRRLAERLESRETVTHVNLGRRATESRDPEDNFLLSTAASGRARFLVTNDRDLLDIPSQQQKRFKFEILTPNELLTRLRERQGKRRSNKQGLP